MYSLRCDSICHDSARECIRLARMSDDPELRYELFEMARQWMALAMEEEHRADGTVAEVA